MSIGAGIAAASGIGAIGSLFAGNEQAGGFESGNALIAKAIEAGTAEQRRQYDTTRTDLAPYREIGVPALEQYGALFGVGREGLLSEDKLKEARSRFVETPGYEFRFEEGSRAVQASNAARGRALGGANQRELVRYGQGVASQEFGNYADRLASLAGMGQGATVSTATFGQQTANNISNLALGGAQAQAGNLASAATARASGYVGAANAVQGGLNNYLLSSLLKGVG